MSAIILAFMISWSNDIVYQETSGEQWAQALGSYDICDAVDQDQEFALYSDSFGQACRIVLSDGPQD